MSKVRVAFLGTPEFAVTCLKHVLEDEHYEVVGVVTQPDRPSGRKMQMTPSPVKAFALARGLRVIAPESVNQELMLQEIQRWGAEVAIVVAFGQILSQKFLDLFPFGAVNVHGSLLPKWRGAAPIQRSLEAGESETGVALQKVVKALDAGDVLGVRKIQVTCEMTAVDLFEQMARLGGDLLKVELMDFIRGNLVGTAQDHSLATYAKKIDKLESQLQWTMTADQVHNKVRAFVAGPGTWTLLGDKKLKILRSRVEQGRVSANLPGTILGCTEDSVRVACGQDTVLELLEVQPESRNRMKAVELAKTGGLPSGTRLGAV